MDPKIFDLVAYPDWERTHWGTWFQGKGKAASKKSTRGETARDIIELVQDMFLLLRLRGYSNLGDHDVIHSDILL